MGLLDDLLKGAVALAASDIMDSINYNEKSTNATETDNDLDDYSTPQVYHSASYDDF